MNKLKVMLVDDEVMTRATLAEHISWDALGFEVIAQAEDGAEALQIMLTLLPDVIISDIRMPKMNGLDFAQKVNEIHPECRIIFLSAYSDKEYLKSAIQLNAIDYVEKPIDIAEIDQVLRKTAVVLNEDRRRRLAEFMQLQHQLVNSLCSSNLTADLNFKEFSILNFPFEGQFVSVIINIHLEEHLLLEERNERRMQLIRELTVYRLRYPIASLSTIIEDRVILLCAWQTVEEEYNLQGLTEDFNQFCRHSGQKVFIAIGQRVDRLLDLPNSYETAKTTLSKEFFKGHYQIEAYQLKTGSPFVFDPAFSFHIYDCLKKGHKEKILEQIDILVKEIKEHNDTPINYIKDIFLTILTAMTKFLSEQSLMIDDIPDENLNEKTFMWVLVSSFVTLDELNAYLKQFTILIFEQLEIHNQKKSVGRLIKLYIQEHIAELNLSVDSVAHHFRLTYSYICLAFKKENGLTINQFITSERMEKAKISLQEGKLKLHEIATNVGYYDAKYFAKVFKKEVGLTPSEYRERRLL